MMLSSELSNDNNYYH